MISYRSNDPLPDVSYFLNRLYRFNLYLFIAFSTLVSTWYTLSFNLASLTLLNFGNPLFNYKDRLNSKKSISPFPSTSISSKTIEISCLSKSLSIFHINSENSYKLRARSPDISKSLNNWYRLEVPTFVRRFPNK